MAQTTIELRHLLQTTSMDGKPFELFDFDYQIDDLQWKAELERAVIDYFYFYEIGQETPDRFKHVFKRRWLQMIGYYNKLHNIDLIEFDPLITYKMTESYSGQAIAKQIAKMEQASSNYQDMNKNVKGDNSETVKKSDYPQQVIGSGYQTDETQSTASAASTDRTTASTTDNQKADNTIDDTKNDTYTKTTEGFTGRGYNSVSVLRDYMDSIIRLTGQVIDEMKPCFMLIY